MKDNCVPPSYQIRAFPFYLDRSLRTLADYSNAGFDGPVGMLIA
jgi:hypothetical protein